MAPPAAAPLFSGDPYGGYGPATLVVCPLVAVIQWGQEIARFTAPGTLKVAPLRPAVPPSCLCCHLVAGVDDARLSAAGALSTSLGVLRALA